MNHTRLGIMQDCPVCAAFPDHLGKHYTLRAIHHRFRYARLRSLGKTRWTELPGCTSAEGYPILATAQMTDHPSAHNVAPGCWLCKQTPDFDPDEGIISASSEEEAEFAEDVEGADEQQQAVEHDEASLDEVGQLTEEGRVMANSDGKGYLAWADGGLGVQIQSIEDGNTSPDVAVLKKALTGFGPPDGVLVTLTETLGKGGAWVALAAAAGAQADLLIATGTIVERLVKAGVYEEVLLSHDQ